MAVLTRTLFLSTSEPPAARVFLRAAADTPLRSLDAATALTMSSLTLGPVFFGLLVFFLAALAGGAAAGAGATSAIFSLNDLFLHTTSRESHWTVGGSGAGGCT